MTHKLWNKFNWKFSCDIQKTFTILWKTAEIILKQKYGKDISVSDDKQFFKLEIEMTVKQNYKEKWRCFASSLLYVFMFSCFFYFVDTLMLRCSLDGEFFRLRDYILLDFIVWLFWLVVIELSIFQTFPA